MSTFPDGTVNMVYADNFTAGGIIKGLKHRWNTLSKLGPKFGYYPETTKSLLKKMI